MQFKTAFLTILISTCATASAATMVSNCEPIGDLSAGLGPVYNQGEEISSCFAFTAADQLTQYMRTRGLLGKDDRIQPLGLWGLYTLDDRRIPSESKNVVSTPTRVYLSLASLRKRGFTMLCKESEFGSATDGRHPLFAQPAGPDKNTEYFNWWNAINERCHTEIPEIPANSRFAWFPKSERDLDADREKSYPDVENDFLAARIEEALNAGVIVGVEYQYSVINPKQSFVHWSSIVARQPRNGKCYYKIRDSFGPKCDRVADKKQCHAGYLWVEKDALLNHTDAVSFLVGPVPARAEAVPPLSSRR